MRRGRGSSRYLAVLAGLAIAVSACAPGDDRQPLIVYSPHGPDLLTAFETRFEAANPDVDVQWLDMGSQEVLDRLRSERANPQADVWFGGPTPIFLSAANDSLLESYTPTWAETVGQRSDAAGRFHTLYLTPLVITYNSEVVDSASAPQDWEDVLDPRWADQVLIRDPVASGTMRSIFGMIIQRSMRDTGGADAGYDWLRRLDQQTREYVLNPTLLYQKLARREGSITLWDMPDIEIVRKTTGYPLAYLYASSGTPLVEDAIALVTGSPHAETAKRFIDFVGEKEEVLTAARDFYRLPAREDIPVDSLPPEIRRARALIRPEPIDWQLLEERGPEWMRYWDENIRGPLMLRLEALSKRFGSTVAVDNLSLEVGRGEFLSLLGPSGCGKTTTLRMIAGFETPTSGRVVVDGRDVTRLPPQRRGFGMVFQSYALFPHLDVFENVAFGLKAQGTAAKEIPGRVADALTKVDLAGYEKRAVQALSGGQQQRVALARALAPEPPLLLLDEPLSNLDAALRERTRDELRDLLQRVGITSIFVTHDQEEAFALSDRIAVLSNGRLQQVGTPEDLYRTPANPFVASFVGRTNFVEGRIVGHQADVALVDIEPDIWWPVQVHGSVGDTVSIMARPEALEIGLPGGLAPDTGIEPIVGEILARRFGGATTSYRIGLSGKRELLVTVPGEAVAPATGRVLIRPIPGVTLRGFPASAAATGDRDVAASGLASARPRPEV